MDASYNYDVPRPKSDRVSMSWRFSKESRDDLLRIAKRRRLTSQVGVLETLIREEAERLGIREPLHPIEPAPRRRAH